MLSSEIERLGMLMKNKQNENDLLQQKCEHYEAELQELREVEKEKVNLENKLAMLASEIERMQELLKSKENTIADLRDQY